jgi:hypothetical protein
MEEQLGWVSRNKEWAAVPYGNKFMLIYKGQQISVHNTLENAMKIAMKETKKK